MFIGTFFSERAGGDHTKQTVITGSHEYRHGNPGRYIVGKGREIMRGQVMVFDQITEYLEREDFKQYSTEPAKAYSARYNEQTFFPHLPMEYRSIQDVVTLDLRGFRSIEPSGEGRVI